MDPIGLRSRNHRSYIVVNMHTHAMLPSKTLCEIEILKEDRHSVAEGVTFYEICPPFGSQVSPQRPSSKWLPDASQMFPKYLSDVSSMIPPGCSWLLLAAPANFCKITTLNFLSKILYFCYSEIRFESICNQLPIWAAPVCSWLLLAAPGCSWLLLAAPGFQDDSSSSFQKNQV